MDSSQDEDLFGAGAPAGFQLARASLCQRDEDLLGAVAPAGFQLARASLPQRDEDLFGAVVPAMKADIVRESASSAVQLGEGADDQAAVLHSAGAMCEVVDGRPKKCARDGEDAEVLAKVKADAEAVPSAAQPQVNIQTLAGRHFALTGATVLNLSQLRSGAASMLGVHV